MNVDEVLVSVGTGRYQIVGGLLFGFMIMYSNISPVTYIFTAGDLKYRCEVPGCDNPDPSNRTYKPEWLQFTTPNKQESEQPLKCKRYSRTPSPAGNATECVASEFNPNDVEWCYDNWVFEERVNTVGTEFGIMCEHNKWKLSLVGSVNNIGQFVGIPLSGIITDKFGRKFVMVFGAVASAVLSLMQSLSVSFSMFLTLELLSSILSSGVYTATFVLAMELILPNQRAMCYSLLECFYPIGAILVGLVASLTKDWRLLLQISNVPALLFLSYYWLTEESMMWLETQGKQDKVAETLKKIAKINKKPLPNRFLQMQIANCSGENNGESVKVSITKDIMRSPTIFWRTVRCSFIWIAVTLVYYGLSINATDIAGNKYLNFILVSAVEIPSCLLIWLVMEKSPRRLSMFGMFVLTGITCASYNFIPNQYALLRMSMFLVGKFAITVTFCVTYMLTAEIFPTQMRATLISLCSMIGRIGSILAPQMTLVSAYFGESVTMLAFGAMAFLAAAVTMTLPESKNVKLPNTVDEAENIGNAVRQKDVGNSS